MHVQVQVRVRVRVQVQVRVRVRILMQMQTHVQRVCTTWTVRAAIRMACPASNVAASTRPRCLPLHTHRRPTIQRTARHARRGNQRRRASKQAERSMPRYCEVGCRVPVEMLL